MAETRIRGTARTAHIVSDRCRAELGEAEAFEEAIERLRLEYDAARARFPVGAGATFRLVFTVDVEKR